MATTKLEKVREHFTTCVICTETYTDPCTLSCHHTFCRKCLTKYIHTQPHAVRDKNIPCASCRQMTSVPDPTRPMEEWAGQLKPSIIIVGLIDDLEQGEEEKEGDSTESDKHRNCSPCEKLGETTPATTWCPQCEDSLCVRCTKMHRVNTASSDHELCDLSGKVKVRRARKVMCKEHKNECIRFHCKDCRKSACQTCCTIHHRACKSVITVESMLPMMSDVLRSKSNVMSKKVVIKSARLLKLKEEISTIQNLEDQVQSEIRSASEKAIAEIRKKEEHLMNELKKLTEKKREQLRADLKTEEIDIQTCNQHCEFINQVLTSTSEMDLYGAYMACESGDVEVGDPWNRDNSQRRQIKDIKFVQQQTKREKVEDNFKLGEIDVTYQDVCEWLSSPVLYDTTDCRTESDKKEPELCDITVLNVHGIQTTVVTDFNNKCVKSFFTRNGQPCSSTLSLHNRPWSITQWEENQVMVAVLASRQIVTVDVTPDLVLCSTLTTEKCLMALSRLSPSSLLASCCYPLSVDILSVEGHVLKSFTTHNNVQLFELPFYLHTLDNKIVVSDQEKKCVVCLTTEGDVMWRYPSTGDKELDKPVGLTSTKQGDILLSDCGSCKVIQLTESGQFVRNVPTSSDGLVKISGIYLDEEGKLFVCANGQIKVFVFA